ncbi:23 kDa jasmonate-induced protein-like [Ziziphus jujuba]|uniref:23 kDa jasmonate-induced protein-like n=1 Tax=Ziziphus jujuba TaxID=326968 RepID=A0A6P3Z8M9_ZIZJJ|nr:23 kDa jasmonate-induced protein-like [Ziziphus jujuba]
MGVFGNPITDETLEGLPRYEGKKTILAIDRARVALNWKNAEGKDVRALQYAENFKATCGVETATLCLVYNATGDTVEYAGHKDWHGCLGSAPYPIMIENGQWGVFLHRQSGKSGSGSIGAVVYRGTNAKNESCDWMLAWNNPKDKDNYGNHACTEIREENHFNNDGTWKIVHDLLWKSSVERKGESNGCLSFVTIGNDDYSIFRAILTLKNANKSTR